MLIGWDWIFPPVMLGNRWEGLATCSPWKLCSSVGDVGCKKGLYDPEFMICSSTGGGGNALS